MANDQDVSSLPVPSLIDRRLTDGPFPDRDTPDRDTPDRDAPDRSSGFIQVPAADWLSPGSELPDPGIDPGIDPTAGQSDRGQYWGSRGVNFPWWIIIASWVGLGLPALGLEIDQLANLFQPSHSFSNAANDAIVAQPVDLLPMALLVLIITVGLFGVLGRETARKIRRDRRQQRFRYRLNHQNS